MPFRVRGLATCLLLVSVLVGCGGSSGGTRLAATPSPSSSGPGPVRGLIAIGHSALTAEGTDPTRPHAAAPENSWATGTNPAVDSIYLRLVAADPAWQGHAANFAVGGAVSATLADQAASALGLVPNPRLVIIQTIDNDIRCDGTDPENLAPFGRHVKAALEVLVKAAPDTTILLLTQRGRPLPDAEAIADDKAAAAASSGADMCSPFDPDLRLDRRHLATLTGIIESYEATQAKVCATVPQCHTDDGLAARFRTLPTYSTPDGNHLNLEGQAAFARFMWPKVQQVLGL